MMTILIMLMFRIQFPVQTSELKGYPNHHKQASKVNKPKMDYSCDSLCKIPG